MFELGWVEIGLIGVIALVVLGPERLPKVARFAGLWVRKGRAQWYAVKAEFEREIAAEELKATLEAERRAIREAAAALEAEAREAMQAARGTGDPEAAPPLSAPSAEATRAVPPAVPPRDPPGSSAP
ncbi:Sec-independent protein translocase protein TatB [Silanimonas lenta]|uniref:Sec-independent protein translocase protein TatB n=1 Tax=Silanimonas lenta TaxID=265429 RepID=UPI000422D6BF|nr:Sec-independent protein translocase protein TatB [Silanimonas lenta]